MIILDTTLLAWCEYLIEFVRLSCDLEKLGFLYDVLQCIYRTVHLISCLYTLYLKGFRKYIYEFWYV